jgi:hypothetical protein
MRDIVIFGIIFGLVPLMIKRPAIGALVFMWISLMNPHRLAYGILCALMVGAVSLSANADYFWYIVAGLVIVQRIVVRKLKPVAAFDPAGRDLARAPGMATDAGTVHARS